MFAKRSIGRALVASLLIAVACGGCQKADDDAVPRRRIRTEGPSEPRPGESKPGEPGGGFFSGLGGQSDEERSLALAEELATIIDDNQTDCEAMAAALSKWSVRNGKDYKELERRLAEKRKDGGADDPAQAKYRARIEVLAKKLMPGLMKCSSNEKVMNALK